MTNYDWREAANSSAPNIEDTIFLASNKPIYSIYNVTLIGKLFEKYWYFDYTENSGILLNKLTVSWWFLHQTKIEASFNLLLPNSKHFRPRISCISFVSFFQEYERAVIFRLGRLVTGGARGPGVFFIIPCVDVYEKIDMRTTTYEIPPQEVKND